MLNAAFTYKNAAMLLIDLQLGTISELAIDWTSPDGQKLMAVLDYR